MASRPRCAIVVPTYNGAHLLSTCLASLLAHPPESCEWQVVVVDDASGDGTAERFGAYDERVSVVAREQNGGFAEACNDGARAAGEVDHLVFLNNDTIPIPGWLDTLIAAADAHPEAAIFGSKLLFPDGTVQHAGIAIGEDLWPHHIYAGFPGDHEAVNKARAMVAVTAACLLIRREAFTGLGGFDTAFHNGYEDVDLCLRAGERELEVRYCPESVLYHLESVTRWADPGMRHTGHNDRLLQERWGEQLAPDDFSYYLADGLVEVEYNEAHPLRIAVSPLLATIGHEIGGEERIEALLGARSREVMSLRSELTRAMLEDRRVEAEMPSPTPPRRRSGGSPELLAEGEFHNLASGSPRHRVSVLMPVIDAGEALRTTLPLLLEQEADAELEVVAVDSASRDDTVDVLKEFGATVLAIDPSEFDHGLTRNLLADRARGDVLVFLNQRSRPLDRGWLAPLLSTLVADPTIAGACSRVLPYPDADPLTKRDGALDPSGSPERKVSRIADWETWRQMPAEQRRLFMNFHTVSAAVRADALQRVPFQSVRTIGEDLLWAREALEAGMALVHEPGSRVYHSHEYSLREWFMRNVDDGVANRDINGRSLPEEEADALVRGMIAADWDYLRGELGLEGEELARWQAQAALRRAAGVAGQWLGANHEQFSPAVLTAFSRVENSRRES
ncbi:MAG: glycosyltransferase [Solirubrobacterales bacterium]